MEPEDLAAASAFLSLPEADFIDRHTALARNRAQLTLLEGPDGACEFLDADNRCQIYPARPRQCRGFPLTWQVDGCPAAGAR